MGTKTFFLTTILLAFLSSAVAGQPDRSVTFLFTNDIHSHYDAGLTRPSIGGLARLKTAVDVIRSETPHALLLDGGDWSEGGIYYLADGGATALRLMHQMGYDAVALGNHDWVNGPDELLRSLLEAPVSPPVLVANLDYSAYSRGQELARRLPPYRIFERNGVKVALIGVTTYQVIYDHLFKPVKVLGVAGVVKQLVKELRPQADLLVVMSHNSVGFNEELLREVPEIDLVIGAHDHRKLIDPIAVFRPTGSTGYLVEAGSDGEYLGKIRLSVTPEGTRIEEHRLIQIDSSIPEDPGIRRAIETLRGKIEARIGPVFNEVIADNRVYLNADTLENRIGNVVTDAFRNAVSADFALQQSKFMRTTLVPGPLRPVDAFHVVPHIWDFKTQKTWTVHTLQMKGRTLRGFLNLLFASGKLASEGAFSVSGLQLVFDPLLPAKRGLAWSETPEGLFGFPSGLMMPTGTGIRQIEIQGRPLDDGASYKMAAGGGIVEAIQMLNAFLPGSVPAATLRDSGLEEWRVLTDYWRRMSPLTAERVPIGNRLKTVKQDLGVTPEDILVDASRNVVSVIVRNYGLTTSASGARVRLVTNFAANDTTLPFLMTELGTPKEIPALRSMESAVVEWRGVLISPLNYPMIPMIENHGTEDHRSNDRAVYWPN